MDLSTEEKEVLEQIGEGISDTHQLRNVTEFKLEKLKEVMSSLEEKGLIKVARKVDSHNQEDFWDAELVE